MKHAAFCTALSVALFGVASYAPGGWPLIFVSLVPLVYGAVRARSALTAFWIGAVVGMGIMALSSSWLLSIRPVPSVEVSPEIQFVGAMVSWVLVSVTLGAVMGVFGLAVRVLAPLQRFEYLALGILWPGLEHVRMYVYNLLTFSSQVSNPPFFSVGFIGYPLADNPLLLQLAVGGVALMSVVVVGINLLFYALCRVHWVLWKRSLSIAGMVAVLICSAFVPFSESTETQHASVGFMSLQSNLFEGYDAESAPPTAVYVDTLVDENAHIILLPEGSRYFSNLIPRHSVSLSDDTPIVVDSAPEFDLDKKALFWGYAGAYQGTVALPLRSKTILTPQGEYLAGIYEYLLPRLGFGEATRRYMENRTTVNGLSLGQPLTVGNIQASVLFCVEVLAPSFAKHVVDYQHANMLFVTLSHQRFTPSLVLETDTLRLLKVQAVEAGVPLVASSIGGPGYALTKHGQVLRMVGEGGKAETAVIEIPYTSFIPMP